jgi:hypothetical protein
MQEKTRKATLPATRKRSRILRAAGEGLIIALVAAALLVQTSAGTTTVAVELGMCRTTGELAAEWFWYAGAVLVIGGGVAIAALQRPDGLENLAPAFLVLGILGVMFLTLLAILGGGLWAMGRMDEVDPPTDLEALGQTGVFLSAYATPAYALLIAAVLLMRGQKKPPPRRAPIIWFALITLASFAFLIIRASVLC